MIKIELHIEVTQAVLIKNDAGTLGSVDHKSIVELLHEKMIEALADNEKKTLTKQVIKQAIHQGALWHSRGKYTKRLRRLKTALTPSDTLHFYYDEHVLSQQVPQAQLIEDFDDYSVWYKPYGMLSQGSKWSDHCTITRFAQQHFNNDRACFIVHRLDKAATGLIIVAHSKKATKALTAMFEAHTFDKRYQIIVHGDFSATHSSKVIDCDIDNKIAKSIFTYHDFDEKSNESLIDVQIETGRKHQIRKHAASIGMPVVGDRLHGREAKTNTQFATPEARNLQLCAVSLTFNCPLSQQLRSITLPEHLRLTLKS